MGLKLNGKPFDPNPLTPTQQKVKAFLDASAKDKDGDWQVFGAVQLSEQIGLCYDKVKQAARALPAYTHKHGIFRLFGHPQAIAQYKKTVGAR